MVGIFVLLALVLGFALGITIGKYWWKAPQLRLGAKVEFQSEPVGMTRGLTITEIIWDKEGYHVRLNDV